jgi:threonine/homoserine/homoserine lactone efflux protein
MSERILAFTVVATLLTITPGIDMALVTQRAVRGGLGEALATSAGILTGVFVWAVAAVVGLAAVLASSATAYTAVKLAGAAYLIYLGVKALLGGRTESPNRRGTPFRQGLVSNLLNPKIAVFYSSVIPQFVVAGDPVFLPALLAGIHLATGIVWLPFYAWLMTRAGKVVQRPAVARAFARLTGAVLVGLGLRLALERR